MPVVIRPVKSFTAIATVVAGSFMLFEFLQLLKTTGINKIRNEILNRFIQSDF